MIFLRSASESPPPPGLELLAVAAVPPFELVPAAALVRGGRTLPGVAAEVTSRSLVFLVPPAPSAASADVLCGAVAGCTADWAPAACDAGTAGVDGTDAKSLVSSAGGSCCCVLCGNIPWLLATLDWLGDDKTCPTRS